MPSVTLYRPPAARRLERNENSPNLQAGEIMNGPSEEKGKMKSQEESKEANQSLKRNETNEMSVFRSAIMSIRAQNKVPKCKSVESPGKRTETELKVSRADEIGKGAVQMKQRRPDIQVYVPRGRRSGNCGSEAKAARESKSPRKDGQVALGETVEEERLKDKGRESDGSADDARGAAVPEEGEVATRNNEEKQSPERCVTERECGKSEKERRDRSPVKSNGSGSPEGKKRTDDSKVSQLNPEECDWESMFDDSGECLDPSLMEQLTSAVGEVTIEKPKSNYSDYKNKSLDMVADEFPHVIEIYNFPPEFQLHDLMTVFSQFKNSGFEIKWVDDTHALGIFSSSAIVSEVLEFYHPFVKTRSLKEGTPLSKMKARRSAEFLQPYKPRPETCSALARRLVTGALGVKLPTFREEREAEKKILTKAREKKRLEAKQRENAWEGTFS